MPRLQVVAITGSNGKTTTKEMIAAILAARAGADAVLEDRGQPQQPPRRAAHAAAAHREHRYAVVEMGMSALGEIAYLTGLAEPDVAVVVSVAPVHLETLGTVENMARAKGEIWRGAVGRAASRCCPVDEPLLSAACARCRPTAAHLRARAR